MRRKPGCAPGSGADPLSKSAGLAFGPAASTSTSLHSRYGDTSGRRSRRRADRARGQLRWPPAKALFLAQGHDDRQPMTPGGAHGRAASHVDLLDQLTAAPGRSRCGGAGGASFASALQERPSDAAEGVRSAERRGPTGSSGRAKAAVERSLPALASRGGGLAGVEDHLPVVAIRGIEAWRATATSAAVAQSA
jgi:hypothetical protein